MRNEFQVHMLNDDGIAKATKLGEIFSTALDEIEMLVPKSREMSLVITQLQEASYWAKRGIAIDPANQMDFGKLTKKERDDITAAYKLPAEERKAAIKVVMDKLIETGRTRAEMTSLTYEIAEVAKLAQQQAG